MWGLRRGTASPEDAGGQRRGDREYDRPRAAGDGRAPVRERSERTKLQGEFHGEIGASQHRRRQLSSTHLGAGAAGGHALRARLDRLIGQLERRLGVSQHAAHERDEDPGEVFELAQP